MQDERLKVKFLRMKFFQNLSHHFGSVVMIGGLRYIISGNFFVSI